MHRSSTLLLRLILWIIGAIVLAICAIGLPLLIMQEPVGGYLPLLLSIYAAAIPFFIALYHTLTLLSYIDKNTAFSPRSVAALGVIKYCAFSVSALYAIALPYIYMVAQADDAPGVIIIGMVFTCAPFAVGVFAAVLQKLAQSAIDIKTENDLTV
jgi:hypothetical protein